MITKKLFPVSTIAVMSMLAVSCVSTDAGQSGSISPAVAEPTVQKTDVSAAEAPVNAKKADNAQKTEKEQAAGENANAEQKTVQETAPSAAESTAVLAFASPFSDNAVIQRDAESPVWGIADPGAKVTLKVVSSDGGKTVSETSASAGKDGKWIVKTKKIPAGGPYIVTAESNGASISMKNVLFGDVWICSGQSNMEMSYGWGLTNGKKFMETNSCDTIRLLNVPNRTSAIPRENFEAQWSVCEPEAAKKFSACGYFFGTALKERLPDIPIGLIDVTWSGTYIQTWLALDSLEKCGVEAIEESARQYRSTIDDWFNKGGDKLFEKRMEEWRSAMTPFKDAKIKPGHDGFDYSSWKTVKLPVTFEKHIDPNFDGLCYYKTDIELTDAQAENPAEISLGTIDDDDTTTINGKIVGETLVWNTDRKYKINTGILHGGTNTIVVRVVDHGGAGGFTGKPENMFIKVGDTKIPLDREWQYYNSDIAMHPPVSLATAPANSFSACYYGMMYSLFPMAVKGAIWYQGCSNVGGHEAYYNLFEAMIKDWRSNFSGGDFPVYIVQLAAFLQTHDTPVNSSWAAMRWTQMRLGEEMENCGTAVTIDVGDHNDIHPKDKKTVGERLARLALVRTYGDNNLTECGPIPESEATVGENSSVRIAFKHAKGLKTSDGKDVAGFQLAGEDGKFVWADAAIIGETVSIAAASVNKPKKVRYAWDDYPVCNLVNGDGIPCGPFELDVKSTAEKEDQGN